MNLLIPDSWLREYLETKATPEQIKEYLSLCGPSIERITKVGDEIVYTIEVTSNRPDSMSIIGIAREAAAILPRFNISAKFIKDPYQRYTRVIPGMTGDLKNDKLLHIESDPILNPRWTSVVLDNVNVKPSPKWLQKKLELTGIRPLNNIVDITNYILRTFGQPAHAFDFDEIKPNKKGVPYMKLRSAKNGEKISTLDGITHALIEGDIVIEDGSGRLIDLCGIMGAENSSIKDDTKIVLLFMQTYNPKNIRRTMMRLSHRTEAGSLFEKGPDSELVLPTVLEAAKLVEELAGGKVASQLYDIYPEPYKPYLVKVSQTKTDAYIGKHLTDSEIKEILTPLGFMTKTTKNEIEVTVPSFRRDIQIDVDVIEELSRIYGYHNITSQLPEGELPIGQIDKTLAWEEEIKVRLRDWGFTEIYTYSMISEELMDIFELDKTRAYKISNPLSNEWVFMRPAMLPSVLSNLKQNINIKKDLKMFELSNIYRYQENDLPKEIPILIVAWVGDYFRQAKGLAEIIFELFGLDMPQEIPDHNHYPEWLVKRSLGLGEFGIVGEIKPDLLGRLGIKEQVTALKLSFSNLVSNARPIKKYTPIPKYPPIIEDMSFTFQKHSYIGDVIEEIKSLSPLIHSVELLDQYETISTFRIHYLDTKKAIIQKEVDTLRQKIVDSVTKKFSAQFKGQLKRV